MTFSRTAKLIYIAAGLGLTSYHSSNHMFDTQRRNYQVGTRYSAFNRERACQACCMVESLVALSAFISVTAPMSKEGYKNLGGPQGVFITENSELGLHS